MEHQRVERLQQEEKEAHQDATTTGLWSHSVNRSAVLRPATFAYDISPHGRHFSGDEAFLSGPNAFNDAANTPAIVDTDHTISDGVGGKGKL